MVLVVTLLSVLFVLGVAFLATMNFEAEMIASERAAARTASGVQAVDRATDELLSEGIVAVAAGASSSGSSANGAAFGATVSSLVTTPGFESFAAPIEPYYRTDPNTGKQTLVYGWFTDTEKLLTGKHANPDFLQNGPPLCEVPTAANCFITASGRTPNNRRAISGDPQDPAVTFDRFEGDYVAPVDVDGDGLRDSYQTNFKYLGFSERQQRSLSTAVNVPGQVREDVYLGLRVVPHGGMVNVNDAHPLLIGNVFDLNFWPAPGDVPDAEDDFFVHAPTQGEGFYTPGVDEPALRRRGFLPPKMLLGATAAPSRLTGNPFVTAEPTANDIIATSDMQRLFWPKPRNGTVAERLRHWPIRYDEEWDDNIRLFDLRMDPFSADKLTPSEYDRRHLVTTTSHDDLLAPRVTVCTANCYNGNPADDKLMDLVERMGERNKEAIAKVITTDTSYVDPLCRLDPNLTFTLPFEYAAYPHNIVDAYDGQTCLCQGDPGCETDPARKGRLKLSLSWLDEAFIDDDNKGTPLIDENQTNNLNPDLINREQRNNLIYDAFAMLITSVVGAYWDQPLCTYDATMGNFQVVLDANGAFVPLVDANNDPIGCPDGSICRFSMLASPPVGLVGHCTATPAAWDSPARCSQDADCGPGPYRCAPTDTRCYDTQMGFVDRGPPEAGLGAEPLFNLQAGTAPPQWTKPMPRPASLISRAAAALAANMIDYVDADNIPTRIRLRSFDYTSPFAGLPLYDINGNPMYVYGVERQPYLSELVTYMGPNEPAPSQFAVELFNPFPDDFSPNGYALVIAPPDHSGPLFNTTTDTPTVPFVNIPGEMRGRRMEQTPKQNGFTVIYNGNLTQLTATAPIPTEAVSYASTGGGTNTLTFENKSTIYLTRAVQYVNPDGSVDVDWIVLDQMNAGVTAAKANDPEVVSPESGFIGLPRVQVPPEQIPGDGTALFSFERVVQDDVGGAGNFSRHWTVTVPVEGENANKNHSLGGPSLQSNPQIQPVEAYPPKLPFGLFASYDPASSTPTQAAFQTTGAMLLLTRHANHSLGAFDRNFMRGLSFTQRLVDTYTWSESYGLRNPDPNLNPIVKHYAVTVEASKQIDNGRMPVFDRGVRVSASEFRGAHHHPPSATQFNARGGRSTLPWGQFVFDFFTSLNLSNPGPYRHSDRQLMRQWAVSRPRVDMNGLRVHGRIDLNAAPWYVMKGIPLVPLQTLPDAASNAEQNSLRTRVASALALNPNSPAQAEPLLSPPAQSIAAYRESREIVDAGSTTGNYGDLPGTGGLRWRGWLVDPPYARRGTGFLTVGELANVRHANALTQPDPTFSFQYRADSGTIPADTANIQTGSNPFNGDYIQAIAMLVALSDWVTVKSHVFTVYGTVRGSPQALDDLPSGELSNDPDERQQQLEEVDARAIRFQETVDRLPLLLSEPTPTRIGGRTLSSYSDFTTD